MLVSYGFLYCQKTSFLEKCRKVSPMHAYQRIIRALLSWRYLVMVAVPLNLLAAVPMLLAKIDLDPFLLILACTNLVVIVAPCLVDRTHFIEGPFNSGNPECQ